MTCGVLVLVSSYICLGFRSQQLFAEVEVNTVETEYPCTTISPTLKDIVRKKDTTLFCKAVNSRLLVFT